MIQIVNHALYIINRCLIKTACIHTPFDRTSMMKPNRGERESTMMIKTISNLKCLYSVNMFILLSREMHIFNNVPSREREFVY